ncbi:Proprotein convertase subtilisin/kexin type 7 [Branchiostoma belcheri]|nr:Proprotein convertase subtilisin/kexin type 7 [Branchiostoma belcheri]
MALFNLTFTLRRDPCRLVSSQDSAVMLLRDEYHRTMEILEHRLEHSRGITVALRRHPCVEWSEQQFIHSRVKRDLTLKFQDPYYRLQWHLHNRDSAGMDLNVLNVWKKNITGAGVTVAVIDDDMLSHRMSLDVVVATARF